MFGKKADAFLYVLYIIFISAVSYFFIFQKNIDNYKDEIKNNLLNYTITVAHFIDKDAAEVLYDKLVEADDPEELTDSIYKSPEANKILDDFKFMQSIYPNYVGWIYTFMPTENPVYVRFIIDAYEEDSEDPSLFGLLYNISAFPIMQESLQEMKPMVEEEISYDKEFDKYVISAFAPIYSNNGKYIGHIGIDMFIDNYKSVLNGIIYESLMLTTAAVFIGVIFIPQMIMLFLNKLFKTRVKRKKHKELNKIKK